MSLEKQSKAKPQPCNSPIIMMPGTSFKGASGYHGDLAHRLQAFGRIWKSPPTIGLNLSKQNGACSIFAPMVASPHIWIRSKPPVLQQTAQLPNRRLLNNIAQIIFGNLSGQLSDASAVAGKHNHCWRAYAKLTAEAWTSQLPTWDAVPSLPHPRAPEPNKLHLQTHGEHPYCRRKDKGCPCLGRSRYARVAALRGRPGSRCNPAGAPEDDVYQTLTATAVRTLSTPPIPLCICRIPRVDIFVEKASSIGLRKFVVGSPGMADLPALHIRTPDCDSARDGCCALHGGPSPDKGAPNAHQRCPEHEPKITLGRQGSMVGVGWCKGV